MWKLSVILVGLSIPFFSAPLVAECETLLWTPVDRELRLSYAEILSYADGLEVIPSGVDRLNLNGEDNLSAVDLARFLSLFERMPHVYVQRINLREFDFREFERLGVKHLRLIRCSLNELPKMRVGYSDIRTLTMAGNGISRIEFDRLPECLEELMVAYDKVEEFAGCLISSLPRLRSLSLVNNRIKEFNIFSHKDIPSLADISLDNNPLGSDIDLSIFPNLRFASVVNCGFEELPKMAFHPEARVRLLILDNPIRDWNGLADWPVLPAEMLMSHTIIEGLVEVVELQFDPKGRRHYRLVPVESD